MVPVSHNKQNVSDQHPCRGPQPTMLMMYLRQRGNTSGAAALNMDVRTAQVGGCYRHVRFQRRKQSCILMRISSADGCLVGFFEAALEDAQECGYARMQRPAGFSTSDSALLKCLSSSYHWCSPVGCCLAATSRSPAADTGSRTLPGELIFRDRVAVLGRESTVLE